jgi:IS5 family transposase
MTILNFRHLLEASDLAEDIFKQINAHLASGRYDHRGAQFDQERERRMRP